MRKLDLVGKRFERLVVIKQSNYCKEYKKGICYFWDCLCDCGNTTSVSTNQLRSKRTLSCGCYGKEQRKKSTTKHGKYYTHEHKMWRKCKGHAKERGIFFDINFEDIIIPEYCPIFTDLKLEINKGHPRPNSPSIDRFDSSKGYTKDNISVISYRANAIKNDASLEELKALVSWLEIELYKDGSNIFYSSNIIKQTSIKKYRSRLYTLLLSAKERAKKYNIPFSLDYQRIHKIYKCPVLGIDLSWNNSKRQDNSPTLDRLVPSKGYTEENTRIISWRANRIKNNASLEDLKAIVNWLEKEAQ